MELDGVPVEPDRLAALALTNYGHFTTMLVEGGAVRGLSLHLERLATDCRAVFDTELDTERVRTLIRSATQDSDEPCVVRATVFDPEVGVGHPGATARPQTLVTTRPAPPATSSPARLCSVEFVRELPGVKHTGLFAALHHRRTVQRNGFDDALGTTADGFVVEAATSNIGFIDESGRIVWPKAECLPGITMRLLTEATPGDSRTAPIHRSDLPNFAAAFLTNAAMGVRPVAAIDATSWRTDHPALAALRERYAAIAPQPL